jgi:isopenicillin N synthase-like dioxygenase
VCILIKPTDCKEAFSFGFHPTADPSPTGTPPIPDLLQKISRWPADSVVPRYRERMQAYQRALIKFSRVFVRTFALALGLEEGYFDKKVTYPMSTVRTLHYPVMQGGEDEETGLGAHTDIERESLRYSIHAFFSFPFVM